ncbi:MULTISPECIES: SDR family NAD(P)-dependent oxidoreductase [Methylobacterium]|uniref:3-oxoacyl-[acyl-carrier-protein] reductase FabG n=3 Tax=Pseudomonadota TaxID=1224 RepID=A0ABQ4SY68_9HYPH|nr:MULTISPECIES: SDR family NAD(P)-dependent oxidoreductase [Methylobacterium]PIU06780.1 MAG: 3-oxoacyl-ACP reductase [Methylobacterium sp. CG09_land_8_20_14_0_10_71_15]GBU17955.1 3-oxoacyl-[acyl-carrier-protein] reductase [Methylobacterium sp.]GJE07474.1 3-oxoacyl-[acyl-carrier-protein] reductase FabG [Methylobacterium jeotgali]
MPEKTVLVTGGSRGLGLAIAQRLSGAGYRVIAVARSESEPLREAAEEARAREAGAIHFRAADLSDIEGLAPLVRGVRKEFGPLHGLVNNAGIGTEGLLATMQNPHIEALIRLNTLSPILLTKFVVRGMMADGAGRIVNLSSIIASTGYSALSVYAATKASMIGFTKSLAREVGHLGITVNAVAPGFIDTELTRSMDDEDRARIARRSALRRLAEPRDVAAAVEFLMGEGGRSVTGTVLTVDAGNTA